MIKFLRNWWHSQQRKIDLKVLWPACKEHSETFDEAIQAFSYHASDDPAWNEHYTPEQLETYLRSLP